MRKGWETSLCIDSWLDVVTLGISILISCQTLLAGAHQKCIMIDWNTSLVVNESVIQTSLSVKMSASWNLHKVCQSEITLVSTVDLSWLVLFPVYSWFVCVTLVLYILCSSVTKTKFLFQCPGFSGSICVWVQLKP